MASEDTVPSPRCRARSSESCARASSIFLSKRFPRAVSTIARTRPIMAPPPPAMTNGRKRERSVIPRYPAIRAPQIARSIPAPAKSFRDRFLHSRSAVQKLSYRDLAFSSQAATDDRSVNWPSASTWRLFFTFSARAALSAWVFSMIPFTWERVLW